MSEWHVTTLGEVGTFVRGRRFTKDDYVESGLGCIHYGQVHTHFGPVTTSPLTFLPEELRSRLRLASPGDVVVAATSENTADLGKATVWLGADDVAVHDDCYIFKHDLDPTFAAYLFASSAFQRQKIQYAAGTKVTRISGINMAKIQVAIPPLPEQRRIVDLMVSVDAQVEALREADVRAHALYAAATSTLWLDGAEGEAAERPLGALMHLDVQRLSMDPAQTYRSAGVLNAGQGLIDRGEFRGDETEYVAMNTLRANQVVMRKLTAWEGPIALVPEDFDGYVASNEFPTFTLTDKVSSRWIRHVCRTQRLWDEMKNRVTGTVQRRKRLSPDQLLSVALPVPALEEQERVAVRLDAIETAQLCAARELASLRAFRSTLLSALLDQEIEVPESYDRLLGAVS